MRPVTRSALGSILAASIVVFLANTAAWASQPAGSARADLVVGQSDGPDPVRASAGLLTYSATITNLGPDTATGVTLKDVLPAKVDMVRIEAARGTCAGDGEVRCALGTLTKSQTARVKIVVRPIWPGRIKNTVSAWSQRSDQDYGNNWVTTSTIVTPAVVDLSVRISDSPDPATVGSPLTYSLRIENNGPSEASDVEVSFYAYHPHALGALLFESASEGCAHDWSILGAVAVDCHIDYLAPGASRTFKVVATPTWQTDSRRIEASALVQSNEHDAHTANNVARASTAAKIGVDEVGRVS